MNLMHRLWPGESLPQFTSPLPGVRTATVALQPIFRGGGMLRYIDPDGSNAAGEIAAARPGVLAGSHAALRELGAALKSKGPSHAVVVLTREGEACLSDVQRDELWDAYRVPLFEQVVTARGRLLAWECEAHDGLHLGDDAEAPARSRVETAICHCGGTSPRVMAGGIAPRVGGPPARRAAFVGSSASLAGE